MEKINVICLFWVGEFRGRDFTKDDVWALYNTVKKHIDREFDFYVLTNDLEAAVPGTIIPLNHDWPGWWSKMELHRPDLPQGRTLYLDLDSHVVSSLGVLLECEGDLVMFPSRSVGGALQEGKRQVHKYQAATMLFTPGKQDWFYHIFCKNPQGYIDIYRSEQDLMGEMMPDLNTFDPRWLMKISELRNKELDEKTIIITGQPKDTSFRDPSFAPWLNELAR